MNNFANPDPYSSIERNHYNYGGQSSQPSLRNGHFAFIPQNAFGNNYYTFIPHTVIGTVHFNFTSPFGIGVPQPVFGNVHFTFTSPFGVGVPQTVFENGQFAAGPLGTFSQSVWPRSAYLGTCLSRRRRPDDSSASWIQGKGEMMTRFFTRGLLAVAAIVSVLAFVAAPISAFGVGWRLPLKVLVTVCLIAPAGFLMGIPFPTGLTRLEARYPQAVRWAWALNAAASVLGSATAIFLAIYIGLRATVLVGAALYLCALLVLRMQKQTAPIASSAVAEVA